MSLIFIYVRKKLCVQREREREKVKCGQLVILGKGYLGIPVLFLLSFL